MGISGSACQVRRALAPDLSRADWMRADRQEPFKELDDLVDSRVRHAASNRPATAMRHDSVGREPLLFRLALSISKILHCTRLWRAQEMIGHLGAVTFSDRTSKQAWKKLATTDPNDHLDNA